MNITRIDCYDDARFSEKALAQHGCFLADGEPFEVEIISGYEAVISGVDKEKFAAVIDEFRFYTPHISCFYDESGAIVREFARADVIIISLENIQPSQFYVDRDKIAAISTFIEKSDDIIIQVMPFKGRYISLDGHTRLYYAVMKGWKEVRAVIETADESIYGFVDEAKKRGILTPYELEMVGHAEYESKWNRFCDEFFAERGM